MLFSCSSLCLDKLRLSGSKTQLYIKTLNHCLMTSLKKILGKHNRENH